MQHCRAPHVWGEVAVIQTDREREGGIRLAQRALICLSPLQCLTEDAGWAGWRTGLRKHYISITVLFSRVLWLCRLFSLAVSSPLCYLWRFSPVLICPSSFPAALIHCIIWCNIILSYELLCIANIWLYICFKNIYSEFYYCAKYKMYTITQWICDVPEISSTAMPKDSCVMVQCRHHEAKDKNFPFSQPASQGIRL